MQAGGAEEEFRGAFWQDVRPMLREWRESKGLAGDPLAALRSGGYVEKITAERGAKNAGAGNSYA